MHGQHRPQPYSTLAMRTQVTQGDYRDVVVKEVQEMNP